MTLTDDVRELQAQVTEIQFHLRELTAQLASLQTTLTPPPPQPPKSPIFGNRCIHYNVEFIEGNKP